MAHQTQHRPHPELTDRVAWMPVSLQPPAPPAEKPVSLAPVMLPILGACCLLLGYAIAMGHRDWQLVQAKEQAAKSQAQVQALQQAKAAYCQGGN
jgi:hypothetical protein